MQLDWWTFVFQVINVAVLMWLLGRFLFKPVAGIIAARKAETDRALKEAEEAKRLAVEAETAARAERDRIAAERVELLEKARAEAEAQKKDLLARAGAEAEQAAAKARAAAGKALEDERAERIRRASELSVAITGRLLQGLPGDGRIEGYADRLVGALGALGDDERRAILEPGGELRLVAPRELTDAERSEIERRIAAALPHEGQLPVEVDPALIAGLELRSRHGVVRNSLAADLARISEAMVENEQG